MLNAQALEPVDEERFFAYLAPREYVVYNCGDIDYAFCLAASTQWMLAQLNLAQHLPLFCGIHCVEVFASTVVLLVKRALVFAAMFNAIR